MGNYYSDDDSLQRSQGAIDGPAFQRPQASPYQRPWYAGTDSRDERTGVEMAQERQRQADQAGISPNDPLQRLIRFGVVGSSGAGPQGVPSPRDMPKALAAESQARVFGPTAYRSGDANPNSVYGQGSVRTPNGIGSFAENGQTYNVGATSQDNIRKVTGGKLNSPLFTNIDPSQAIAGLNDQRIGQPADEARLGLDRYQRANDIRGQMIANRDKDIPAGGYAPAILGDPNEALNAERTQRWRREELMQSAKNNPELRGIIQQLIQSDSARGINENNVAGRMNELGLQGRNQLAAEDMRQRGALGLEGLRRAGRKEELSQQGADQWALQEARLGAEAPYRDAQAGYYGAQTRKLDEDMEQGKTEFGMATKLAIDIMKTEGGDYPTAFSKALKTVLGAQRAAAQKQEGKAVGYGSGGEVLDDGAAMSAGLGVIDAGRQRQAAAQQNLTRKFAELGGYNNYADGGAVQPMSAAEKLLAEMDAKYGKTAGNAPAPAPQPAPAPAPQPVQQPQGMADKFRGYFGSSDARMKQNGLAFGGAVPAQDVPGGRAVAQAVAGRQVFGQSDGSGRDDALPAVIDGERPAALTSGEFVWPVNAVKYFGMAKLNKMLAEAERGMAPQDEPA